MKLLLCPKGYLGVRVKNISVYIDLVGGDENRGYALVCDAIADDLLKKPDYEIVDPSFYPRDIDRLYDKVRRTLKQESFPEFLAGVSKTTIKSSSLKDADIPTPVFIPAAWTKTDVKNWPVALTYTGADKSTSSFVFDEDSTLPRPCVWCRFKYWLRNKFRRNK